MASFVEVARVEQLPLGSGKVVRIDGKRLLFSTLMEHYTRLTTVVLTRAVVGNFQP